MHRDDIKKLSDKELVEQLNYMENFTQHCAVGKSDLIYQDWLFSEADERGLELKKSVTYEL